MTSIDLDGTVVAMTGASVGLGKSMSLALAQAGARVVLAAPETLLLEQVAAEIEAKAGPGRALPLKTDITIRTDCERLLAETIRHFGKLQVLVNNARRPVRGPGLPPAGNFLPFWESYPYIWQESVQVNVNGTLLLSHLVTPHLIANGWGRIVNINTSLGGLTQSRNSPYGVTKAALESATMIFAADLAGTGVTVNTLLPGGATATSMTTSLSAGAGKSLLDPAIMGPPAVWLASAAADSVSGARVNAKRWDASLPGAEAFARARAAEVIVDEQ
jgi:NAD(P)-dependent dehydrogenase (short-subunit alcohol dehydrogenase family)